MGGLHFLSLLLILIIIFSLWTAQQGLANYCIVSSSSSSSSSLHEIYGFYAGSNGVYLRIGDFTSYLPNFLSILQLKHFINKKVVTVSFLRGFWTVSTHFKRDILFINKPPQPEDYLYTPPENNWVTAEDFNTTLLQVRCNGNLASTPVTQFQKLSNLEKLLSTPVTSSILGILTGVFVYLAYAKIPVESVSFSYNSVVLEYSYWRLLTASLSHFEVLHIFFNATSFYSMGVLESLLGSAAFLYLNINLIIITMFLCTLISHILIYSFSMETLKTQQSIGFSCVLFAWMVVCFFFPSFFLSFFPFFLLSFFLYLCLLLFLFSSFFPFCFSSYIVYSLHTARPYTRCVHYPFIYSTLET